MNASALSIITGARNRPEGLQRLADSIFQHTTVDYELIIADASDIPLAVWKPEVAEVRIISEYPRLGYSKGYNGAIATAKGKWILWLNDDTEVVPGYDVAAIRFMQSHPDIGLGALYYREGSRDFHVNSYFEMCYANFGIMDREFFNQIGGFPEQLPMYGSDNAIAFEVLLAGKGIAGIPDAKIIHHATDDESRRENNDYQQRCRDAELLATKYGPHMDEMKATYARLGCEASGLNDQTPAWLEDKIKA